MKLASWEELFANPYAPCGRALGTKAEPTMSNHAGDHADGQSAAQSLSSYHFRRFMEGAGQSKARNEQKLQSLPLVVDSLPQIIVT